MIVVSAMIPDLVRFDGNGLELVVGNQTVFRFGRWFCGIVGGLLGGKLVGMQLNAPFVGEVPLDIIAFGIRKHAVIEKDFVDFSRIVGSQNQVGKVPCCGGGISACYGYNKTFVLLNIVRSTRNPYGSPWNN